MTDIPVSTKWVLDSVGETASSAIKSVLMIQSSGTRSIGTGFLLTNGWIVTAEHVVRDNAVNQLLGRSPLGTNVSFSELRTNRQRDLALLAPSSKLDGGLDLDEVGLVDVGSPVTTWGFPLGYNGPTPLLSTGYVAGYRDVLSTDRVVKHLVVNGAFNPGNSGGPLFRSKDDKVIGVVVSKHVPFTEYHLSAIEALAKNKSGVVFTYVDDQGNRKPMVESQIVAELLDYFRSLTQVMIGEAVSAGELDLFLEEEGLG